ncbi:MAG: tetratricopeptide repeat protein, partial [Methanobacteriota archaeon]
VAGAMMMVFNGASLSPFFLPLDVFLIVTLYLLIVLSVMNFFFRDLEVRYNVRDSQKYLMAKNSQRAALVIVIICVFLGVIVASPFTEVSANRILSKNGSETLVVATEYTLSFDNQDRLALFKTNWVELELESGAADFSICEKQDYEVDDICNTPFIQGSLPLGSPRRFDIPQSGYWQYVLVVTNTGGSSTSFRYHLETTVSPAFVGLQPLIIFVIFIVINSIWIAYLQPVRKRFATSSIYSEDYLVEAPAEARTTARETPVITVPGREARPTAKRILARAPEESEEPLPPPPPLPGIAHPMPKGAFLRELIILLNAESDRIQTEDFLRTLIEMEPMNSDALAYLGNMYQEDGKYDLAYNQFDRITKIDSKNEEAWVRRGDVLLSMNRDFDAIQSFREALKINPENPGATEWIRRIRRENQGFMAKAIDRSAKHDFKGAIELYDLILSRDPDNVQALLGKGTMYRRLEKWPASLESLNRVLELEPDNLAALHNKAEVFEGAAKWEEALACYDKIVELAPGNYLDWIRRGDVHFELNNSDGALESYKEAENLKPDSERVKKRIELLAAPSKSVAIKDLRRIPGIGKSKAVILYEAGYMSIEDLREASVTKISKVKGVSKKMAKKIKDHLKEMQ